MLNINERLEEEQEWKKQHQQYLVVYFQFKRLRSLLGCKCSKALQYFFKKYSIKHERCFVKECHDIHPDVDAMETDLTQIEQSFGLYLWRIDIEKHMQLELSSLKMDETTFCAHVENYLDIFWNQIKDGIPIRQDQIYEWICKRAHVDTMTTIHDLYHDKFKQAHFLLTLYFLMLG